MPVISAAQVPSASASGIASASPEASWSGTWKAASSEMIAPAAAARMTVARRDRTEAPMVTGAMMRSAKGFSRPPVR